MAFLNPEPGQHELTEGDRVFKRLISETPAFRLRWLEVDDELSAAVTEFLADRIALDPDPLLRSLPAVMIVQIARYVLEHWLLGRSIGPVAALLRRGLRQVFDGFHRTDAPVARTAHG